MSDLFRPRVPGQDPLVSTLLDELMKICATPEAGSKFEAAWLGFTFCYDIMRVDPELMIELGTREGWNDDRIQTFVDELRRLRR